MNESSSHALLPFSSTKEKALASVQKAAGEEASTSLQQHELQMRQEVESAEAKLRAEHGDAAKALEDKWRSKCGDLKKKVTTTAPAVVI